MNDLKLLIVVQVSKTGEPKSLASDFKPFYNRGCYNYSVPNSIISLRVRMPSLDTIVHPHGLSTVYRGYTRMPFSF